MSTTQTFIQAKCKLYNAKSKYKSDHGGWKKNPGEIDVRKENGKRKRKRYAPLKEWEN